MICAAAGGTLRKMRQNLGWAIGCNSVALPIAVGVFEPAFGLVLRPEIAALSMSGSSFLVAVNALLLKRLRLPSPRAIPPKNSFAIAWRCRGLRQLGTLPSAAGRGSQVVRVFVVIRQQQTGRMVQSCAGVLLGAASGGGGRETKVMYERVAGSDVRLVIR